MFNFSSKYLDQESYTWWHGDKDSLEYLNITHRLDTVTREDLKDVTFTLQYPYIQSQYITIA